MLVSYIKLRQVFSVETLAHLYYFIYQIGKNESNKLTFKTFKKEINRLKKFKK